MKFISFVLIALLISCKQKNSSDGNAVKLYKIKKLEFLTYGLPSLGQDRNAEAVVSHRWGFGTKVVAGCIVSEKLVDSVRQHNQMVEKALALKYGKEWNARYDKEVKEELTFENKVIAVLNKEKRIIRLREKLNKEVNGLTYYIWPIKDGDVYEVSAMSWGKLKGNDKFLTYIRYHINSRDSSVNS